MPKQTVQVEIEVPPGYEATGEFRTADCELHQHGNERVECLCASAPEPVFILRRVKPKTVSVELDRKVAEGWRDSALQGSSLIAPTREACRAALAREVGETVQPSS